MSHKSSVADALVDHMESVAKRICQKYIRSLEQRVQRLEDDNERLVQLLRGRSHKSSSSRSPTYSRSQSTTSTTSSSSSSSSSGSCSRSASTLSSRKSTSTDSIKPRKIVDVRTAPPTPAEVAPRATATTTTAITAVEESPVSWWEEEVKSLSPEVLLEGTSAGPDIALRYTLNGRPAPYFRRCRIPLFAYGLNGIKAMTSSPKALAQLLDERLPDDARISMNRSDDGLLWFKIQFDQHVEADGFARLLWATWNGSKPKKRMVVLPEGVELVVTDVTQRPAGELRTALDGAPDGTASLGAATDVEPPQQQQKSAIAAVRKRRREDEKAAGGAEEGGGKKRKTGAERGSSCESLPSMDEACAVSHHYRANGASSDDDDDDASYGGFFGSRRTKARIRFARRRPIPAAPPPPPAAAPAAASTSEHTDTLLLQPESDPLLVFASSVTPLESEALRRHSYGIQNALDDHETIEHLAMDSSVNPLDRVALHSVVQKARFALQKS